MTLGDKLKKIRLDSDTPEAHIFAVQIGVTPPMVYAYEKNKKKPGFDVLQNYINKFDVDSEWLFANTENEVIEPSTEETLAA